MESEASYKPGPHQLQIVRLHDVDYFVDIRMNQFREVENPHNFIDFDTEIGQQMWSECNIAECPNCGVDDAIWGHESGNKKVCSLCGCSFIVQGY